MTDKKSLNSIIDKYMMENPKRPSEALYYRRIADKFEVHPEKIRKRWRMLNKQQQASTHFLQIVDPDAKPISFEYTFTPTDIGCKTYVDVAGGNTNIEFQTEEKIENLEDIIRVCKIDTNAFDVTGYEVKTYNAWIKNEDNKIETKQLYSVKATLKAKKLDTDLGKQKDLLIAEIKKSRQNSPFGTVSYGVINVSDDAKCALEINIPDLHIGKLAWGKETGEDYDIKEAIKRYQTAVRELISRVNVDQVDRFILPIGNDMINVDNKGSTTTAGTPQSCDSRFGKMFQTAKELIIETIEYLRTMAPVDIIVVAGNHDTVAMFTLGEVLDAWYHGDCFVKVYNQPTQRKYYQYGATGLMFTHGNEEKHQELGMIFATEQPKLWADTKYRFCKVGHYHKTKKLSYVSVDEFQGFQVETIPSLSGTDAWHHSKGYNSLKGAKAYLYHKDKGRLAEYSYYL
jgi:hypothetical protein